MRNIFGSLLLLSALGCSADDKGDAVVTDSGAVTGEGEGEGEGEGDSGGDDTAIDGGKDDGCGCATDPERDGSTAPLLAAGLIGVALLRRRREQD